MATSTTPGSTESPAPPGGRFPVVGLGASAGGLAALDELFVNMPSDTGLAFVVITHQHPHQTSLLAELLGRKTSMPVVEVSCRITVEPNHVYTIRPGYDLAITNGVLQPMQLEPRSTHRMPIDYFFRSMARDLKERAVGIVLSGTGSDGTLGLEEIKAELGLVIVQDEQSAQYRGMPHSAIATDLADYVLPVSEMPARLVAHARTIGSTPVGLLASSDALQQIFVLIHDRTGHDFSQYKESTLGRRLERRMSVHHTVSIEEYAAYLRSNPTEIDLLIREILIGVTSFFRDSEAWEALSGAVRELLTDKPGDYVFRAWVVGCSTGEEAYSLAILLRECMDALQRTISVQIFATDLHAAAIDIARAGIYPLGIANDVSSERLTRFFIANGQSYHVKKEVRELLVFAEHDLLSAPPFTKLDLLSCRNLLIYLNPEPQRRLLPIFHYSLKTKGVLFLGSSESIGSTVDLFAPIDKKWKIFRRRQALSTQLVEFAAPAMARRVDGSTPAARTRTPRRAHVEQLVDRVLLREMVPPTVVVGERGDVLHIHGKTGQFLEPAQGSQATANIFNMVRDGLQISLMTCMRDAMTNGREAIQRGVQVKSGGGRILVDVRVMRLTEPEPLHGAFRVSFEHVRPLSVEGQLGDAADPAMPTDRLQELERELRYTKESHQGTIEELETANEELKSTNEELQSTNEELQSANEELETSKEEMQSLNEELQTVNAELQSKVDELSQANNDMKNLLNGTDIATVFVDGELRIKRYTEQAKNVIRLIPSDIGRPVGDLVSTLRYDRLVDDAREVLRTLVYKEAEVHGENDEVYLMRILPYRTTENVIDGLVLIFVDVTQIKTLKSEQARLVDVLRASPVGVFELDDELRFVWASNSVFGREPAQLIGQALVDLFAPDEAKHLGRLGREVLDGGEARRHRVRMGVNGVETPYDLYIEPRRNEAGELVGISCVAIDILAGPEQPPY